MPDFCQVGKDKGEQRQSKGVLKYVKGMVSMDIRKTFFPERAARFWNRLPMSRGGVHRKPGRGTQSSAPGARLGVGPRLDSVTSAGSCKPMDEVLL